MEKEKIGLDQMIQKIEVALTSLKELRDTNQQDRLPGVNYAETDDYKKFAASVLRPIEPTKPYGTELFDSLAWLTWSIAFEALAFRPGDGGEIEVYLRRRASNDSAYAGEWHAPGSVFHPHETEKMVAGRLAQEFGVPIVNFYFVGECADWEERKNKKTEERGCFCSRICLVELSGPPREDDHHGWYSIKNLPENMVWSHRDLLIPLATREWEDLPYWLSLKSLK